MLRIRMLAGGMTSVLIATNFATEPMTTFVDPSFAPAITETVSQMRAWVQPDGKIIIAGSDLRSVNGTITPAIARLNSDGSLDSSFRAPGDVWAPTALGFTGEKIVFASAWRIRRLHENGPPDEGFFAQAQESLSGYHVVYNLFAQPDGSAFVTSTRMNESIRGGPLVKLTPTGTIDVTFKGEQIGGPVLAQQVDGKILVASTFTDLDNKTHAKLVRASADGIVDASFNSALIDRENYTPFITEAAVQTDGKILAAGSFTTVAGKPRRGIARFHTDGTLDETFDPGAGLGDGYDPFYGPDPVPFFIASLEITTDQTIYVSGRFSSYDGVPRRNIARLFNDGRLDPGFNTTELPEAVPVPLSFKIQNDGKLVVSQDTPASTQEGLVLRLNTNGTIDTTFKPKLGSAAILNAMAVSASRVYVAGYFREINAAPRQFLGALNHQGQLDATFAAVPIDSPPNVLLETSDGKLLIGGKFQQAHNNPRPGLARLKNDGALDDTFISNLNAQNITAISIDVDGTILVGGKWNSNFSPSAARLDANGTIQKYFPLTAQKDITAIIPLSAGKSLIAGDTLTISNQIRKGLARLNQDGTLDPTFNAPIGLSSYFENPGKVEAITLLPSGKILAGGAITNAAYPNQLLALIRLNEDGSLDSTFSPVTFTQESRYIDPYIRFVILPDDRILLSGRFTQINGVTRFGIARISANGTLDPDFEVSFTGGIAQMHLAENGSVLTAGDLAEVDGIPRTGLIRLLPTPVPHPEGRALKLIGGRFDVVGFQMLLKGMSRHRAILEGSTDLQTWTGVLFPGLNPRGEDLFTLRYTNALKYFRAVEIP